MKDLFNFKTTESSANVLGAGEHDVRISGFVQTNDRCSDLIGTPKKDEDLPPWSDPTIQLAVTFVNSNGVITRRYSRYAYRKYEDLTPQEQKSGKFKPMSSAHGSEEYACIDDGNGGYKRVIDKARTEKALSMLSDITAAGGHGAGEDFIEALTEMKEQGTIVRITVEERSHNGKVNFNVKSVRKATKDVIATTSDVEDEQLAQ